MSLAVIDWMTVLVVGVPAYIAALAAAAAALISARSHRQIQTPSGDSIGKQVEETHHLANTHTALLIKMNGGAEEHDDEEEAVK